MARSLYKGDRLGTRPPCLICMGPGRGERALLHLPGGVSVWLCAEHRGHDFLTRRAGRDLVASLLHAWRSAGCLTKARHRALDAHLKRFAAPAPRRRPGSYAWPELRAEAEARFAAGEPPPRIIDELRARPTGQARPPSRRTIARWFGEGRWLRRGGPPAGPAPAPEPSPPSPARDRPRRRSPPRAGWARM